VYLTKDAVHECAVVDVTALKNSLFDSLIENLLKISHTLSEQRLHRRQAYAIKQVIGS
jgi:hypothetical protein